MPPLYQPAIGEKRDDGAWRANFIAVIKMINSIRVEVDGLLDHSKPQKTSVEVDVALRIGCDRRHMVNTCHK